jgi:hypothetical protein
MLNRLGISTKLISLAFGGVVGFVVLEAATELSKQSETLGNQVDQFISRIRSA